jgi:hypothetical protein
MSLLGEESTTIVTLFKNDESTGSDDGVWDDFASLPSLRVLDDIWSMTDSCFS